MGFVKFKFFFAVTDYWGKKKTKTNQPDFKMNQDINRYFTKKDTKMANTWKDAPSRILTGKCNLSQ